MTITPEQLADWKALAEKATNTIWWAHCGLSLPDGRFGWEVIGPPYYYDDARNEYLSEADAGFIAAARVAVPALIAEVERFNAANDRLRAALDAALGDQLVVKPE